jgi:hypothetical protein
VSTNAAQLIVEQLIDAKLRFGVQTMEGREMHSLVAGKSQLSFSVAADEDVGKVDRRSGKVTFVGQSPLEMVRGSLAHPVWVLFHRHLAPAANSCVDGWICPDGRFHRVLVVNEDGVGC